MFRTGLKAIQSMPDYQRQLLKRVDGEKLLRERYGVKNFRSDGDERIMSCILPFGNHKHGDRNPAASLNVVNNLYNCFVCGGGSLIWLVSQMENVSTDSAVEILRQYQREMTDEEFEKMIRAGNEDDDSPRVIREFDADADHIITRWCQGDLTYWKQECHLRSDTISMWKLGYDPIENRATVPHYLDGKLIGWTKRSLDGSQPKWSHSTDFPKADTLFNYDRAKQYKSVVVVESPISAIWLYQCGVPNVVASFGARPSPIQAELLRRFGDVIIWDDPDPAGWDASLMWHRMLAPHTNVWMVKSLVGKPHGVSCEECWDKLYRTELLPSYLFQNYLKENLFKEVYDGLHEVRNSRGGSSGRGSG
jgi:DNA primase